jgi:hypothetical protein
MCRLSHLQGFGSFLYLFLELTLVNLHRLILDLVRDSMAVEQNVSTPMPKFGFKQRADGFRYSIVFSSGRLVL